MIVSDKYQFVIACPTKTGTNTLRAVVQKWKRQGGSANVLDLLTNEQSTRHRIAPPPGKEDYTRYIMVRDPAARLVSMYEYLRRKEWEWCAKVILDTEFSQGREAAWLYMLDMIIAVRNSEGYFDDGRRKWHGIRPYMWTDRLSEMEEYLAGYEPVGNHLAWHDSSVTALQLEDLDAAWADVLVGHDVEEDWLWDVTFPHRNASPVEGRLFDTVSQYLAVHGASSKVMEIVGPDDEFYGVIDW